MQVGRRDQHWVCGAAAYAAGLSVSGHKREGEGDQQLHRRLPSETRDAAENRRSEVLAVGNARLGVCVCVVGSADGAATLLCAARLSDDLGQLGAARSIKMSEAARWWRGCWR